MFIADLHTHSKYSRATSRECIPEYLDLWARRKGIDLIGTGDFTHPAWRQELKEKLTPAGQGLYQLKKEFVLPDDTAGAGASPHFILSGEISCIYKKNGRVRKVHNVILLPCLEAAEILSKKLERIGNIHSDGRPILGLDSRDLLEITLEACPQAIFIPAHIWTPHFSLFGAFSGFNTIEECYEDLTPYIHALETGLSSDPPMNWRLSALDRFTLISNSDAHSPQKLGREANIFDLPLSYDGLAQALRDKEGFMGTIEFFPEEGKYHLDGHRKCSVCLSPSQTASQNGRCPVCGGKLTIGVLHRVEELADREEGFVPENSRPYESLVPLPEVIAASTGLTPISKKVNTWYGAMLQTLGPEFYILRQAPLEEIQRFAGPCITEGVRRVRAGEITALPGYDGEFGKIQILSPEEVEAFSGQTSLFGVPAAKKKIISKPSPLKKEKSAPKENKDAKAPSLLFGLNDQQQAAVNSTSPVTAVIAGPGTGKTKTLIARIAHLIQEEKVPASRITAVTFTNKAAQEMRQRLDVHFQGRRAAKNVTIGTFHSVCLELLGDVNILGDADALTLAHQVLQECGLKLSARKFLSLVSQRKNGVCTEHSPLTDSAYDAYEEKLTQYQVLDYDDILLCALALLRQGKETRTSFTHLLVDEFQDTNPLQFQLINAFSQQSKSLFVIGDPDQSIYGFRGAGAQCFERLAQERPDLETIYLSENYRSTPQILSCALPVIANNHEGVSPHLTAQRPAGAKVSFVRAGDEFQEALFIAKEINRMVGGIDMLDSQSLAGGKREFSRPMAFCDIAVLYRTHRQAQLLEKCLSIEGIPYVLTGREDFLCEPLIRGSVGFFRFLMNSGDLLSLYACLTEVMGLSQKQAEEVTDKFKKTGSFPQQTPPPAGMEKFLSLYEKFSQKANREKPQKLLEAWAQDTGLTEDPSMEKLINISVFYKELAPFLRALALGGEGDVHRSAARRYFSDAVSLATLHGAKGLEFPVVFLCGVKRGVLPFQLPDRESDLLEERRLFYVGMTRAQEELILLSPGTPSLFLDELPAQELSFEQAREWKEPSSGKQLSLF